MATVDLTKLDRALGTFKGAYADSMVATMIGSKLTCGEVDALAGLLAALGAVDWAAAWIESHARSDSEDDGDQHYGMTEEDIAGYLHDLVEGN